MIGEWTNFADNPFHSSNRRMTRRVNEFATLHSGTSFFGRPIKNRPESLTQEATSTVKKSGQNCETHYLGWDTPLLTQATEFLRDQHALDGCLDLSNMLCVLPTARGVRRLATLLHETTKEHTLEFCPPKIITTGQLAEHLYRPAGEVAMDFEQTLAWAEVLQSEHEDNLLPLLPTLPARDSINAWLELAGTLRRLHLELAASQLSFSDVASEAETEAEQRRWNLLSRLLDMYLQTLQDASLLDPHWARRQAIEESRCQSECQIVLVGTSDLSDVLVAMLRAVQSEVVALIAAPESEAFRFDEFGSVETTGWQGQHLPICDEQLLSAGDVADQSAAVAEVLSEYADEFSADCVTVGVTDESQVGPIELELRGCGVKTYRHLGWTIAETAIGRLIDLTASHLQRGTWQTLAALVRHADVYALVTREIAKQAKLKNEEDNGASWLAELDGLLAAHFPLRVADPLPKRATVDFPTGKLVGSIVNDLVAPFVSESKSIGQWCMVVGQWLTRIYGKPCEEPSEVTRTQKACSAVRGLLQQFANLNSRLDVTVNGAVALETLGGRLGELRVGDAPEPDDVEILGWLDLALDDAPAMVVMGLNHPFVPGAVTSDPFLPGGLRTKLRMADNDRRYARDAYAMQLILSTRSTVRFIVGRNGADGSPTPPSRLIAAAEPVDSARRIRHLLHDEGGRVPVQHHWDTGLEITDIPVPKVNSPCIEVPRLSVTAFRDYMVCPYRFYLRHVLRIRPVDDATGELAANQFGDLVHGTLEWFGESDDKSLTDAGKIEEALMDHLHRYAKEVYGDGAASAVKLQVRQAERRLKFVAQEQAKRIAAGWVIAKTEASVRDVATAESAAAGIVVDGKRMGIRGRFDRIDHHPDTNRWAILDYKTHGHKPEKKHLRRKDGGTEWIDLQLPLYRMMIPFLGIDADPKDVELGYFNVSEKQSETRINIADFSEKQMDDAVQLIHQIIRNIWDGKFDPTNERVQYDDYEMILQSRVPQRLLNQMENAESGVPQEGWS